MIERWGSFVARRALAVLLAGLAVAFAAGAYGFGVFDSLSQGGFDDAASESARELALEQDTFGNQGIDVVAIYSSEDLDGHRPGVPGRGRGDRRRATPRAPPAGSCPTTPRPSRRRQQLVSKDGHAAQVLISLAGTSQDDYLTNYDELAPTLEADPDTAIDTDLAGAFAVFDDVNEITSEDLARAETISMPIVLVLALLIFGSLVAASMPALVGLLAMVGALALVRVITNFTEVSIFSVNVISLLGIGLAIDYALFVVSRFREELALLPVDDPDASATAIQRTMSTAGRTVLFSGLTVAAAMSSLLIFPQAFLRSMGYGGMAAVLVAMLAALTVLPATLRLLGRRIDGGRLPWRRRRPVVGRGRARPLGRPGPRRDAPAVAGHRHHRHQPARHRVAVPRRELGQRRLQGAAAGRPGARRGRQAVRVRPGDLDRGAAAHAAPRRPTWRRTPPPSPSVDGVVAVQPVAAEGDGSTLLRATWAGNTQSEDSQARRRGDPRRRAGVRGRSWSAASPPRPWTSSTRSARTCR